MRFLLLLSLLFSLAFASAQSDEFGSATHKGGALVGILYDLKQDQRGKASGIDPGKYIDIVDEFLESEWDEQVLDRFYRSTQALYATRIFIPLSSANAAPRAFGVEGLVKPRLWIVHYKGQVSAPTAGRFRFAGFADDVIAVAVNGKTVLLHGRSEMSNKKRAQWGERGGLGMKVSHDRLRHGDWIDLKDGEIIDLDVIVGERPGGSFGAFLYWQQEGKIYEEHDGGPVLPVFQLDDSPLPEKPRHASGFPIWTAVP